MTWSTGWWCGRSRPWPASAAIGCDRALIDATLDGWRVQTIGLRRSAARDLTTGRVSTYLGGFVWGFLLILGWVLLARCVEGGGHDDDR